MSLGQTTHMNPRDVSRRLYLIDGNGVVLGRLAALAAGILRGKGKVHYSPHMDVGDTVVVVNCAKVVLTGNKAVQKIDFRYSGYRGGQVYTQYGKLMKEKPDRAVRLAVYGMLPKNRLRGRFIKRLKVFRGDEGKAQYPSAQPIDTKNPKVLSGGPFAPAGQA
jgi:large subunit ribosomal protein L13